MEETPARLPRSPSQRGMDDFHLERSRCLDAFAQLEAELASLFVKARLPAKADTFGQKLKRAGSIVACPWLSHANVASLKEIILNCGDLLSIRNDLVHSRLLALDIDGEQRLCLINSGQHYGADNLSARVVTLAFLKKQSRAIRQVAKDLKGLTSNPASSPPPPGPGAAGGP